MILSHIVAVAADNGIGRGNDILFRIPEDQKHFRETTKGHIMIMGRKTYDSLGKPLPGRFHIVVSRQELSSNHEQVLYVSSLDEAYAAAKNLISKWPEEVF